MKTKNQKPGTGTRSGIHFHQLYQKCPRKFFIQYVKNVESAYAGEALVLGSAFHAGKESFYLNADKGKAIEDCISVVREEEENFFSEEIFQKVLHRAPTMLESWIDEFGFSDLEKYNVFSTEDYIEVALPHTGNTLTMRLDAVLEHKQSGATYIMETKSTQSSLDNMVTSVRLGDQATAYIFGFKSKYPDVPLTGMVYDVTFWSKSTTNPELIKHKRGFTDIIYRSKRDISEWVEGMNSLISEISQKVQAYKDGVSEYALFPRIDYWCNAYYRPCEFSTICRGCDLDDIRSDDFVKVIRKNQSITEETTG